MPSKPSSFPRKRKMKRSRIFITPHKGTGNSVNGIKNGADTLGEPMWTKLPRYMHSAGHWILLFTTNYSSYLRCQLRWLDLSKRPENLIEIGAPLLDLLEDSNDGIHTFGKSWKKNLRSMLSHDPLLSDRTEDKDADVAEAVAVVVEDSLRKSANTVSTITSVSIAAYPDTSLLIVPHCQIHDLVPVSDHKAADRLSDKSIPFQKKGWRNCHLKTKAELTSLPLINSNHWSNSIWTKTRLFLELSRSIT